MVGISAALALQARSRHVVLADRRGPAEETSYGNAGLIQREAVLPHAFPRDIKKIIKVALGRASDAHLHWRALPEIAPFLYGYWRHGTPERIARTASAARPLVEQSVVEHEALMAPAGVAHLARRTGYLKLFRNARAFEAEVAGGEAARARYGVESEPKTNAELHALEPDLNGTFAGGVLFSQPVSCADPGALGKAYADLFVSRGGQLVTADAHMLEPTANGWLLRRVDDNIEAPDVVVALGPWSRHVLRGLGIHIPMGVKRGYHMQYRNIGNSGLTRPVIDVESGYALVAMTSGTRLTTGAEFASLEAPPTPVQLALNEPRAREIFPLGERTEPKPWLGARPCFPDMLPMIGSVPGRKGLWLDTGHHHLGFTLGPVTGRLLAELITGIEPFTDPRPYSVDRFA